MRTIKKSILEKVLIDMGFEKDRDKEDAAAGWMHLGDCSISTGKVQRIIECAYDELNDAPKQEGVKE